MTEDIMVPTRLLRSRWPPNSGLMPGCQRFDAILDSARNEGIQEPLTIDLDWFVIDGHHRLEAAKLLGIDRIRVRIWTTTELIG